jgi:hypothetical protein
VCVYVKYVKTTFECSKRHYQPQIFLDLAHQALSPEKSSDRKNACGSIVANMPCKKELTSDQRKQVVSQLLLLVKDGDPDQNLMRGVLKTVATNFNVTGPTVSKIWKRARQSFADPTIAAF